MKRTIVIGDIHGALKALEQVIERIQPFQKDHFIFLGDYVDGWSESRQVIDFLIAFSEKYTCSFIRGNHDTWCEEWLLGNGKNETWQLHGGVATVESYLAISETEKQKHLDFFRNMKNYHIDEINNLFIHAGFSSMHGPEREMYHSNYSWDRTLWEMACTMDTRIQKDSSLYPKRLKLFNRIFIGHTPTIEYDTDLPINKVNVWNLDTGAGFYGKISALDICSGEIWQSNSVRELYPDEKGRNKE